MGSYLVRRLLLLIPAWFVVAFLTFLVMYLVPGDPVVSILGPSAAPEARAQMLAQLGLDKPFWERFATWTGGALHGDLGNSIFMGRPVLEVIAERAEVTISIGLVALVITVVLGLGLGTLAAMRPNSRLDFAVTFISLAGLSIPEFLLGLGLILLLGVRVQWFPVGGYVSFTTSPLQWLHHLVLPCFTLGFINSALVARMTRASVIDVLASDFPRTARAKGLSARRVLLKHALRPALVPISTVIGFAAILTVSGAFITEIVFTLPGIGQMAVNAVLRRDYPLVQGVMIVVTTGILLLNLLVDLLYGALDPRVRYE